MPNNSFVTQASQYWKQGKALEAGRLIFENLPKELRPKWASEILKLVVDRAGIKPPSVENITRIADHPNEWNQAHDAFKQIRKSVLELDRIKERSPEKTLLIRLLMLAENVAKVIYNSSKASTPPYPYPFDEDAGWWIAASLKDVLDGLDDEEFSKSMWAALCNGTPQTGGVSDANG